MGEDVAFKSENKKLIDDYFSTAAKIKDTTKGKVIDKALLKHIKDEADEEEEINRTISNMIDRLRDHFMEILDLSMYKPDAKYHFIIDEIEHFKLLAQSGNNFRHDVERALASAMFDYHINNIVELKLKHPEVRFEGESIAAFEERKSRPIETKRKQMKVKCLLHSKEGDTYGKLQSIFKPTITFVVSEDMLKQQSIHELKVDEINSLVQFNCMIMGFNGTIQYNEILNEYVQTISVMEPEDETVNNNPRIIPCVFHADQTQGLAIGQRKKIIGKYHTIPTKADENIHKLMIDVISVQDLEESHSRELTSHELSIVKEMINTPVYDLIELEDGKLGNKLKMTGEQNYIAHLIRSFAPHIEDRDLEKLACFLALIGGSDINEYRPESHLALVGDPGCGKSELLKFAVKIAPKGAYVDASNATGKGLLFALDEHEGGKILRAGAMVMNSGGMVGLDEFDKMKKEEQKQVNVAMEQQFAKYDKGGHNVIAATKTTVIIACNPRNDKWNNNEPSIIENLNFGASTVSRFDVFIKVANQSNEMANRRRVKHILKHSQHKDDVKLDTEYLKGLIAYCKAQPVCMTEEAERAIEEFYVYFKSIEQAEGALPIEDRQIIGIIRLCCAYARLTFQPKVTLKVVEEVVSFYKKCLKSLGMEVDKGQIGMNLAGHATNKDRFFEDTFSNLAKEDEKGFVYLHELGEALMADEHFPTIAATESYIEKRKTAAYLYEPKPGVYVKQ